MKKRIVELDTIYHQDCIEGMEDIGQGTIDLLLTDPPYNLSQRSGFHTMGRKGVDFGEWDKNFDQESWLRIACDKIKQGGSAIVFNDYKNIGKMTDIFNECGLQTKQMITWCLAGTTEVYTLSHKGVSLMNIRDLYRLDPLTIKLWNGTKWTQLLGISTSISAETIKLILRSGEEIIGTINHQFPTNNGLKRMDELLIGDVLEHSTLPEPVNSLDCNGVPDIVAWFIGLYLAEGSISKKGQKTVIQISGHSKETQRFEKVLEVARFYGGSATVSYNGNNQSIRVYGKILPSILKEFIWGSVSKDKHLSPKAWRFSNKWLKSVLDGYLSGDGGWDEKNQRWRLGFTDNKLLVRDLRVLASRLDFRLVLKSCINKGFNKKFKGFRGEIRFNNSTHWSRKDPFEVISISKSKAKRVYDLGVEDEPHLFALVSGVLTHNCKPNPWPKNRDRLYVTTVEFALWAVKGKGWTFNRQRTNYENGIFNFGTVNSRIRKHNTQKPLGLIMDLLRIHSNENDLILDPFSGSGTISVGCRRLNRHYISFEIDKEYYDSSIERMDDELRIEHGIFI